MRRLQTAKGRSTTGQLLAEGPQAVREALVWGHVSLLVIDPKATPVAASLAQMAADKGVVVVTADSHQMADITDTINGQGVVAACHTPAPVREIVMPSLVLILDEVRDPGNVGTLIRTADAFGADAVVTTVGTAEPWNPKSVRASVGSVFHLPIITGIGFAEAAAWGRAASLTLLAADARGLPLFDHSVANLLAGPIAWVVGNEAAGLPRAHLDLLDQSVAVPMWGRAESLNVAAAAAICLYTTALAQRKP